MAILITGASGFIGSYVVKKLIEEKQSVKLFVREPSRINFSSTNGFEICKGNLTDKESVYNAVEGCETVLHLGAIATKWERKPAVYYDVNLNGTKNIFDACIKYNVNKVVYTSTPLSPVLKNNSKSRVSGLPEYVKSKLFSEQLADLYINKGLDISIVYPTRVFGLGKLNDANSATQVIDKYLRNKFPFIVNGRMSKANWAFVEDVAEGIILTAKNGKKGKRYVLGGENINDNLLFDLLDEISKEKHLRLNLPYAAALGIAYAFDFTSAIIPYKPLITSQWLKALCANNAVVLDESIHDLGYQITPLKDALERTVSWLRNNQP